MLKSTHRPAPAAPTPQLPPGWTEHKAPSGHTYYYNSETKKSTYTRPAPDIHPPPASSAPRVPENHTSAPVNGNLAEPAPAAPLSYAEWSAPFQSFNPPQAFPRQLDTRFQNRRPEPQDRPKSKHPIPNCAPWLLIKTRLRRRFVHNPETGESFWKYPKELVGGIVEFDIKERKKAEAKERGEIEDAADESNVLGLAGSKEADADMQDAREEEEEDDDAALLAEADEGSTFTPAPVAATAPDYNSDEYEEVEVTDDEDPSNAEYIANKRQKLDQAPDSEAADAPVEFTEDDMAHQLALMGSTYDLDPGEYGGGEDYDEGYEEGAQGLAMTHEEASSSFKELLIDFGINPYKTWEQVIDDGRIIDDQRYTYLPNTKTRKQVFAEWSAEQIEIQQAKREREAKKNPRIPYLAFLQKHASAKLYWPEFRRKYKKETELKDTKLNDKEREKLYRDYVRRVSTVREREREDDLWELLESQRVGEDFNRDVCRFERLPEGVLQDVRLYVLNTDVRDKVLRNYARTLPYADEAAALGEDANSKDREAKMKELRALREREHRVEEEKRRQRRDLREGRERLREEEEQTRRAMKVGKSGLKESLAAGNMVQT